MTFVRSRRSSSPTNRRPFRWTVQQLEARDVPASLILQQGVDNGFGVYAGTIERRVDGLANTGVDGSTLQNYFIDSSTTTGNLPNAASADQQALLLFSNLFGNSPGQIPLGSVINSATLTYTTSTVTNADSPGPFGAARMLVAWDQTSLHAGLGLGTGPYAAGAISRPSGGFQSGTFNHASGEVADCNVADIVQAWSDGASNFGFNARAMNTDNGWSVCSTANTNLAFRPKLTIDYTPTTGTVNLSSYQQGVSGYADAFDIWLQQSDVTTLGSTITGAQFLDGTSITAPTSPTDSMLLRFDKMFGTDPGQVPTNAKILRANLVIVSGTAATTTESNGPYGVAQMLVPFDGNSKYTSFINADGPTAADGEIGPIASIFTGMVDAARVQFNVTGMVNNWRTGQDNFGLLVGGVGIDDGWAVNFTGSTLEDARPQLQIYWQPGDAVPTPGTLDIFAALDFNALGGVNDVAVSLAAGVYTITDVQPITLTAAATIAGWSGSGTNKVTGPDASVNSLVIRLGDSADSFTLNSVNDSLTVFAGNSVGDAAVIKASTAITGLLSLTQFDTIATDAGVVLGADSLTLDGFSTLGSALTPLQTKAKSLDINSGKGGAFIVEADGADAKIVTATAFELTNTKGLLNIVADSGAGSGSILVNSGDDLTINGQLATLGTITLNANTDGVGTEGLAIGVAGALLCPGAISITVNTTIGGTGNALVGASNTANASSISVDSNGGSILYGGNGPLVAGGGINGTVNLKSSGAGSIGTSAARIQVQTGTISAESGSGGIFIEEGSAEPGFLAKAIATGAGDITVLATSAANNGIQVSGPVTSGSGTLSILCDDDFQLIAGGSIGGVGFSGKVVIEANRDAGNAQVGKMAVGTTIETSNTSADAVTYTVDARTTTAIGGAVLGSIKVGSGGGITINVAKAAATAGLIIMNDAGAVLDAGPTGTVTLKGRENSIGLAGQPIRLVAGTVIATTTSTVSVASPSQDAGYIFLQTAGAASFTATTTTADTRIGTIDIETLVGDMTLAGNITTSDGTITLKTPGNLVQTGGIVSTTGKLSLNYVGTATFTTDGNTAADLTLPAGQNLTVNGTLTSGTPIAVDATLRGGGTINAVVNVAATGKVAPGASPGVLGTGNLTLVAGSVVEIELNGSAIGTGYDQVKVTGSVDLGNATLNASLGFSPNSGEIFTIVDADSLTGTFNNLPDGKTVNIGGTDFVINYANGNVTLKVPGVAAAPPTATILVGNGSAQRSLVQSFTVTFSEPVVFVGAAAAAFNLQRLATSTIPAPAGSVTLDISPATGPASVFTITFNDPTFAPGGSKSLIDGKYLLTLAATQIKSSANGQFLDGDGNATAGDDKTLALHRLFGDADGDADADNADFVFFRAAFGNGPSIFDSDGDGDTDNADFVAFRSRFGTVP